MDYDERSGRYRIRLTLENLENHSTVIESVITDSFKAGASPCTQDQRRRMSHPGWSDASSCVASGSDATSTSSRRSVLSSSQGSQDSAPAVGGAMTHTPLLSGPVEFLLGAYIERGLAIDNRFAELLHQRDQQALRSRAGDRGP